eukprot:gene33647-52539_t
MGDEPPAPAGGGDAGAAAAPAPPLPLTGELQRRLERSLGPGAELPPFAPWGALLERQGAGARDDAPQGRPAVVQRYVVAGRQGAAVRAGATHPVAEATGFEESAGSNRQAANVFAFGIPGKEYGVRVDPTRMAMHHSAEKGELPPPLAAWGDELRFVSHRGRVV